jgi:hypothetical protein
VPASANRRAALFFNFKGYAMDRQEKHHQQKAKQHEEKKKEQREYDDKIEKSTLPFHPAWIVAVGVLLTGAAILTWTFQVWPFH